MITLMIKHDITPYLVLEKDILDGHMIGDASVFVTGSDCKRDAVMVMNSKYREYTEWLIANTKTFSTCKVNEYDIPDNRTGKSYHRCTIKSYSNPLLTERRKLWYPEGKKIIPSALELTKDLVLRWYMDDGSWHKSGLYLCTNAYSMEHNIFLKSKLESAFNGIVKIHKHSENSYRLFISNGKSSSNKLAFLEYIGKCPVSCFSHKWRE